MNPLASKTYKFSLICSGLPLIAGLIIFSLWSAMGWSWLEDAGFFTLLGGMIFFVAGSIMLLAWRAKAVRSGAPRQQVWTAAIFSALLLLTNFLIAGAIIWKVNTIKSTYFLTIKNNSLVQLEDDVHFYGVGYDFNIGTIPSIQALKLKLHPVVLGESSLTIKGRCGNNAFTNIVEGYFETGYGGKAIVTVGADGHVRTENLH